jgi:hypothetical protein
MFSSPERGRGGGETMQGNSRSFPPSIYYIIGPFSEREGFGSGGGAIVDVGGEETPSLFISYSDLETFQFLVPL